MSTAEIHDLPDGRKALVRYFPPPADSTPNAPIPIYIGPTLLGQRIELELRFGGRLLRGVCVAIHRSNGVVVIAPCARRREDGSWATLPGKRLPYVREEIVRLTVDDLDAPPR